MAGSATGSTAESRKTMLEPSTAATSVQRLSALTGPILQAGAGYHRSMTEQAAMALDGSSDPNGALRHDEELSIAVDAARRAGRLQMERYERLERIVHKSEHDVVTEVDEMSEQLIIAAIRATYPHDGFLAEESGQIDAVPPDPGTTALREQRVWIIDPLDGTVNYANGI